MWNFEFSTTYIDIYNGRNFLNAELVVTNKTKSNSYTCVRDFQICNDSANINNASWQCTKEFERYYIHFQKISQSVWRDILAS